MLADRVTKFLQETNIVIDADKEVVKFGLESLVGNLLGIILTLSVGACFDCFVDAVFLWLFLFPLRKTAGGFHASTKISCFFISTILLVISFALFSVLDQSFHLNVICTVITSGIIWIFAPVENAVKQLDVIEYKIYQVRSRRLLLLGDIILAFALLFQFDTVIRSISMAFFIVSVSVLLGIIKCRVGG